jgi:cAMP phosphodiesterase
MSQNKIMIPIPKLLEKLSPEFLIKDQNKIRKFINELKILNLLTPSIIIHIPHWKEKKHRQTIENNKNLPIVAHPIDPSSSKISSIYQFGNN